MTDLCKIREEIRKTVDDNNRIRSELDVTNGNLLDLCKQIKDITVDKAKKEPGFRVGDVVISEKYSNLDGKQAIVLNVFSSGLTIAYIDDCNTIITMYAHKDQVKLTGKHYDEIASVFANIGEVKDEDLPVNKAEEKPSFRIGDVVKIVNSDIHDERYGMVCLVVGVFDEALYVLYKENNGTVHILYIAKEVVEATGKRYENLSEIISCFDA